MSLSVAASQRTRSSRRRSRHHRLAHHHGISLGIIISISRSSLFGIINRGAIIAIFTFRISTCHGGAAVTSRGVTASSASSLNALIASRRGAPHRIGARHLMRNGILAAALAGWRGWRSLSPRVSSLWRNSLALSSHHLHRIIIALALTFAHLIAIRRSPRS